MATTQAAKRTGSKKKVIPKSKVVATYHGFIWEGKSKKGVIVKGEMQAPDIKSVRADLRKQGITPVKVVKKRGSRSKPITNADIALFARQLTTMMRSGVPIVQGLEMVGNSSGKTAMRQLVQMVANAISNGSTFADALSEQPKHFDSLFVSLVDAGEQAGTLETMLDKVATYKEKTEALKAKIKKALMYPIMVLVAALVVSTIMLIFVIPQFKDVFSSFGADLPAFTQMVIDLSDLLTSYWWAPAIFFTGLFLFIRNKLRTSEEFRRKVDVLSLKIPVVGEIIKKACVARFCRTLSTIFAAGVPLIEAMSSVAKSTGNIIYEEATFQVQRDTSQGVFLNLAMQTTNVFPTLVLQMVRVGEESGRLDEMLGKCADYYEGEVDNLVDNLSKQIEPLIMAVLGLLVGGLVIAMYMPIFKMGSVV